MALKAIRRGKLFKSLKTVKKCLLLLAAAVADVQI
jgi:hypothetical protein